MSPAPRPLWPRRVRAILDERRISIRAFAKKMGVGYPTFRSWLAETRKPLNERTVVARIAKNLGCGVSLLTDETIGESDVAVSVAALVASWPEDRQKTLLALLRDRLGSEAVLAAGRVLRGPEPR